MISAAFRLSLFFLISSPVFNLSSFAQTNPTSPESDYSLRFKNLVLQGCLNSPPDSLSEPSTYCECYAESFLKRYNSKQLKNIALIASKADSNAYLVAAMMSPESKACLNPS